MITLEQAVKIYEESSRELNDNSRIFAYAENEKAFFFLEMDLSQNFQEILWVCDCVPCVLKENGLIVNEKHPPDIDKYKCLPGAEELYAKHKLRQRAVDAIDEELEQLYKSDSVAYERKVKKISTVPDYEAAILKKMQELEASTPKHTCQ